MSQIHNNKSSELVRSLQYFHDFFQTIVEFLGFFDRYRNFMNTINYDIATFRFDIFGDFFEVHDKGFLTAHEMLVVSSKFY